MSRAVNLSRVLRRTARRLRGRRALLAFGYAAVAGGVLSLLAQRWLSAPLLWGAWLGGCTLAALGAALRPVLPANMARALDRSHGLPDTLQAALQFRDAAPDRTGFMALLAEQAEQAAARLSPARAVSLPFQRAVASSALGLGLLLASAWPPALPVAPRHASPAHTAPTRMAPAVDAAASPLERAERVMQAIARGQLTHDQAVDALLEAERALRAHPGPLVHTDGALLAELTALFEGNQGQRLRSLASIARAPAQDVPQQRADAEQIAAKRRELEALRAKHEKDEAAQRTLSELQKRMSNAQQALQQNAPDQASRELNEAQRQVEEQRQQTQREAKQEATAQQLSQLRELLQRRAGAARSESQAEANRRGESERRFSARAGGTTPAEQTAPREAGGVEAQQDSTGGDGAGDQPDPGDGEPDLFARGQRPRVSLDDHLARSQSAEGDSRSEVIATAADRGFATAPYQRVYGDYRRHAEELLAQDEIPAAYRFYVRRYFQLIKPRPTGETRRRAGTGGDE